MMDVPVNEPMAYVNGRYIPQRDTNIGLNDAGFVLGATISDYCRTFGRRLFRLAEHCSRFQANCLFARVPLQASEKELAKAAEELVRLNVPFLRDGQEFALIMLATPGPIDYMLGSEAQHQGTPRPTLILHTFPLPYTNYASMFREGARLVFPTIRQIPRECIDPRIKHRSRLNWYLASRETLPPAWTLLLDQDGRVTETSNANFMIVRGGRVLSPPSSAVLPGISRRVTKSLCAELGIPFQAAPLSVADCLSADEAILTGSAFCLAGVKSIQGTELRWPGPITEALMAAWTRLVGLDYRAQILAGQ